MRDWKETIEWYKSHRTARELGFNPDHMCLKVCRTARDIDARYSSAKIAQDSTPERFRVYKVRDLRRGMVGYFDDVNDSNKFGHIATMVGRVPGFDEDSLHDTLWETNSAVKGQLAIVRGDYFQEHWGDAFQFGATILNGLTLDVPSDLTRVQKFRASGSMWQVGYLDRAIKDGKRRDLVKTVTKIDHAVGMLKSSGPETKIGRFIETYEKRRVLDMPLLKEIVKSRKNKGPVKDVQTRIWAAIKALPDK